MSDRIKLRAVDPEVADGTYDVTVTGGVASLAAAGGGSGGVETIVAGTGIAVDSTDPANPVVSATGGGSTDPEVVRDTMATALVAGSGITLTPDDAADTITIAASGGGGGASVGEFDWAYEPYQNRVTQSLRETRVGSWGYTGASVVGGGFIYNASNAQNDSIAFSVWIAPGTYTLAIVGGNDTNRAIQTWAVDDGAGNYTTLGTLDWYAAGSNDQLKTLSGLVIGGSLARRKLRATSATRNASSSGWYQSIQRVTLLRTA